MTPAGDVTTLAGQASSRGSADGTGTAAQFTDPWGLAPDAAGNVYVSDGQDGTIRKVTPAGVVTTFAGNPEHSGSADGVGCSARFNRPEGVAVDGAGNTYVADTSNRTVRRVTPSGNVTTIAGAAGQRGASNGTGSQARFTGPYGVALGASGAIYVADGSTIRKIAPDGVVTTLAGVEGQSGNSDGTGSAARFGAVSAIAVDQSETIFVTDCGSNTPFGAAGTIRRVTPEGAVTTIAGSWSQAGNADGTGSDARFLVPLGIAVDGAGTVYVTDTGNGIIRRVTPEGVVTTLAGRAEPWVSRPPVPQSPKDGIGSDAAFGYPWGIAVGPDGNIYVADGAAIRKVTTEGVVTTVVGGFTNQGVLPGPLPTSLNDVSGLAFAPSGDLVLAAFVENSVLVVHW